eukprot:scaffold64933_cov66-Phaeocystis_antarctica.AAC.3
MTAAAPGAPSADCLESSSSASTARLSAKGTSMLSHFARHSAKMLTQTRIFPFQSPVGQT